MLGFLFAELQIRANSPRDKSILILRTGDVVAARKSYRRELASALQRRAAAFEPWLSHAECNGPGLCGIWASAPQPVAPPAP